MARFLDIITRHLPQRCLMLAANEACLAAQSDPDYEQHILTDGKRRGFQHAARLLTAVNVSGDYVLILDDDDLMINADGIRLLKEAAINQPAAVIFRGWHGDLGLLPGADVWRRRPRRGTIGSFDFIIRRDLFLMLAREAVSAGYNGDFAIIDAVFERGLSVVWLDAVLCAVMRRSLGQ